MLGRHSWLKQKQSHLPAWQAILIARPAPVKSPQLLSHTSPLAHNWNLGAREFLSPRLTHPRIYRKLRFQHRGVTPPQAAHAIAVD
jgi:hypothetical protein